MSVGNFLTCLFSTGFDVGMQRRVRVTSLCLLSRGCSWIRVKPAPVQTNWVLLMLLHLWWVDYVHCCTEAQSAVNGPGHVVLFFSLFGLVTSSSSCLKIAWRAGRASPKEATMQRNDDADIQKTIVFEGRRSSSSIWLNHDLATFYPSCMGPIRNKAFSQACQSTTSHGRSKSAGTTLLLALSNSIHSSVLMTIKKWFQTFKPGVGDS